MNSGLNRAYVPVIGFLAVLGGCGPASRRDLSNVPQRQITFDDMCHLQDYFDQRNATHAPPFRSQNEQSTETADTEPDERGHTRRVMLGEGTYLVEDRFARREFAQLLDQEYSRLPTLHLTGRERTVQVHVGWWASGLMRRLRPDMPIDVTTDDGQSVSLPFNPCVGEFLFGAPIYALRRRFIEAERARARGEIPPLDDTESSPPPEGASPAPSATDGGAMPTPTAADAATGA